MIDSDKSKPRERINGTKQRIVNGLSIDGQPGLAWVTDGRTVENYVPAGLLADVLKAVSPKLGMTNNHDKWSDVMRTTATEKKSPDKVKVARGWRTAGPTASTIWTFETKSSRWST